MTFVMQKGDINCFCLETNIISYILEWLWLDRIFELQIWFKGLTN